MPPRGTTAPQESSNRRWHCLVGGRGDRNAQEGLAVRIFTNGPGRCVFLHRPALALKGAAREGLKQGHAGAYRGKVGVNGESILYAAVDIRCP